MRILLVGYGKMGKAIEEVAMRRGHEIAERITTSNQGVMDKLGELHADVAIEFTIPEAAKSNAERCLRAGIPVVCGTTGWNNSIEETEQAAVALGSAFLHASNFSVGVNLFFELNNYLTRLMAPYAEYLPAIEETHHIHKKDAPSGTALTLVGQILKSNGNFTSWIAGTQAERGVVPVLSHRIDAVPGPHVVHYSSPVDSIAISHTAHTRDGFALGAVLAAEFIVGKKGIFKMKDVLKLH